MKRDMDLVREILIELEKDDSPDHAPKEYVHPGYSQENVDHHLRIMAEAGLINIREAQLLDWNSDYEVEGLTWDGHEFLEVARQESFWKQAKKKVQEKTGVLTLEMLKSTLQGIVKQAMNGED